MTTVFIFEIKGAKKKKNQFFKEPFFRNGLPCDYDFWCVFRHLCEASKKYNFPVFFNI